MDTSLSQALIIIASVLLAMLVIAFVTQTFMQTSNWASAQDQEEIIEQVQKFNKEWEAYDKKLMYGVDVISCLNKAKSNNEKITSGEFDKNYEIKVSVELNNKILDESMKVYHIIKDSDKETEYTPSQEVHAGAKTLKELNFKFLKTKYSELNGTIFGVGNESNKIKTQENKVELSDKTLELNLNTNSSADIIKLLDASAAVSQIIKNPDYASRNSIEGWTKVEFKSALYYLKVKKFTCTGITYKSDSGRVDTITFKEL